jgi:hypothetical protein
MKRLSYFVVLVWVIGFQGVAPGFATEQEVSDAVPQIRQAIIAQSSTSVTPAPHFKNVEGTLKEIQGNVYVVEGQATQQPIRVEIWQDTAFPNGQKKPGQFIHALVFSNNGHALIVR